MALLPALKDSLRWHKAQVLRTWMRRVEDARVAGHARSEASAWNKLVELRRHPLRWWKESYLQERVREVNEAPLFCLETACQSRIRQLDGGDGIPTLGARGNDLVGLYWQLRQTESGRVTRLRADT